MSLKYRREFDRIVVDHSKLQELYAHACEEKEALLGEKVDEKFVDKERWGQTATAFISLTARK